MKEVILEERDIANIKTILYNFKSVEKIKIQYDKTGLIISPDISVTR